MRRIGLQALSLLLIALAAGCTGGASSSQIAAGAITVDTARATASLLAASAVKPAPAPPKNDEPARPRSIFDKMDESSGPTAPEAAKPAQAAPATEPSDDTPPSHDEEHDAPSAPAEKPSGKRPAGVPSSAIEVPVLKCVDGDTIMVRLHGKAERIRMKGVDTPETVHPTKPVERFGKEASNFTKARLTGKTIWLELDNGGAKDKYGRYLAYIWMEDGSCHNETLLREGFAHAYTRYPFDRMDRYRSLEKEAREKKRGLWGPDKK